MRNVYDEGWIVFVSFIPAHRSMTFRSSPACSLMFRPAFHAHLRGWEVYRCKCTYTKYEKCTCMQQNSVVAWTPNLQVQSCQGPQQSTTRSSWQDVPFLIPLALRLRDLIKDARRVREYAEGGLQAAYMYLSSHLAYLTTPAIHPHQADGRERAGPNERTCGHDVSRCLE